MHRTRATRLLAPLLFLLPACGDDAPPPEQSAEASLEQFTQAVGAMEDKKETLAGDVDSLREEFREQLDKHLALLQDRLDAFETRIALLPAERETALRQQLQELAAQSAEVRRLYETWASAAADAVAPARTQLDDARAKLREAFETFESQIAEAETAG